MLKENGLIGGEESGGIGISFNSYERDGIFTSLLLCELITVEGEKISKIIDNMFSEIGPHYFIREDIEIGGIDISSKIINIRERAEALFGIPIGEINEIDGLKIIFKDGGWILIRASGTEPIVRIYAEMKDKEEATRLLEKAKGLIL